MVKRDMTSVILGRAVLVTDKHVCVHCGNDANILNSSYECVTQEFADTFSAELKTKQVDSVKKAKAAIVNSPTAENIYQLTLREQENDGPREHARSYQCINCLVRVLRLFTGNPLVQSSVTVLLTSPPSHALFMVYCIPKDCVACINAPFQDVRAIYQTFNS